MWVPYDAIEREILPMMDMRIMQNANHMRIFLMDEVRMDE